MDELPLNKKPIELKFDVNAPTFVLNINAPAWTPKPFKV